MKLKYAIGKGNFGEVRQFVVTQAPGGLLSRAAHASPSSAGTPAFTPALPYPYLSPSRASKTRSRTLLFFQVWLATFHGTPVAVKTILPALQSNEKLVKRFLQEIELMSGLHHPNVVLFLGACTKRPNLCLVLEYCVHGSLHHFLKASHEHGIQITLSLILRFALDIARGVYYLHRRCSVVQRDLKARNILVDGSLNAKVRRNACV